MSIETTLAEIEARANAAKMDIANGYEFLHGTDIPRLIAALRHERKRTKLEVTKFLVNPMKFQEWQDAQEAELAAILGSHD